jgi:hypothetical protein
VPACKHEALVQIPVPPKKKKEEAKIFPSTIIKGKKGKKKF